MVKSLARLAWALWLKSGLTQHHWIVTSQLSGSAALAAARKLYYIKFYFIGAEAAKAVVVLLFGLAPLICRCQKVSGSNAARANTKIAQLPLNPN